MTCVNETHFLVLPRVTARHVPIVLMCHCHMSVFTLSDNSKVKPSHTTPMEAQGVEETQLLLIHHLGTRWG
jgi:hypothetical protein